MAANKDNEGRNSASESETRSEFEPQLARDLSAIRERLSQIMGRLEPIERSLDRLGRCAETTDSDLEPVPEATSTPPSSPPVAQAATASRPPAEVALEPVPPPLPQAVESRPARAP